MVRPTLCQRGNSALSRSPVLSSVLLCFLAFENVFTLKSTVTKAVNEYKRILSSKNTVAPHYCMNKPLWHSVRLIGKPSTRLYSRSAFGNCILSVYSLENAFIPWLRLCIPYFECNFVKTERKTRENTGNTIKRYKLIEKWDFMAHEIWEPKASQEFWCPSSGNIGASNSQEMRSVQKKYTFLWFRWVSASPQPSL